MRTQFFKALAGVLFTLALIHPLWPASASDYGEEDHERAHQALKRGEVTPMAELLNKLEPHMTGELIGVELEKEHGRWLYEFKLIEPDGRIMELEVDAKSGEILSRERD
ncbi:MAG: PepSY domain-containing protein [Gammaproteobacteria bacterium]